MLKQTIIAPRGMFRDLDESKSSNEHAFEVVNMRIATDQENSFLVWSNEIGTKEILLNGTGNNKIPQNSIILGHCSTLDSIIVFVYVTDVDHRIYKLVLNGETTIDSSLLYKTNDTGFGWLPSTKIETMYFVETEDIKRVYWVDGINPVASINIVASDEEKSNWNDHYFISTISIDFPINVEINKGTDGQMYSGVVQYCMSYLNNNGAESPIFYISPLYYIHPENRGGAPDQLNNVSFSFNIKREKESRKDLSNIIIYRIFRPSLDAIPEVTKIGGDSLILPEYSEQMRQASVSTLVFTNTSKNSVADVLPVFDNFKYIKKPLYGDAITFVGPSDIIEICRNVFIEADDMFEWPEGYSSESGNTQHEAYKITNTIKEYKSESIENISRILSLSNNNLKIVYSMPLFWENSNGGFFSLDTTSFIANSTSPLSAIFHTNFNTHYIKAYGNDLLERAKKSQITFVLEYGNIDITNKDDLYGFNTSKLHTVTISINSSFGYRLYSNKSESTTSSLHYTDRGEAGIAVPYTDLLYKNTNTIIPQTFTKKDNTLFLGNISLAGNGIEIPETLVNYLKQNIQIVEDYKILKIGLDKLEGSVYNYKSQLKYSSQEITTFKSGETYRFGIQCQDKLGQWTTPIHLEDKTLYNRPLQSKHDLSLSMPKIILTAETLRKLKNAGFIAVRPLVVFPENTKRSIISQGVVCPTIYNLKDRKTNSPYAQASWFMRPNAPVDIWGFDDNHFLDPGKKERFHKSDVIYPGTNFSYFGFSNSSSLKDRKTSILPLELEHPGLGKLYNLDVDLYKQSCMSLLVDDIYPNSIIGTYRYGFFTNADSPDINTIIARKDNGLTAENWHTNYDTSKTDGTYYTSIINYHDKMVYINPTDTGLNQFKLDTIPTRLVLFDFYNQLKTYTITETDDDGNTTESSIQGGESATATNISDYIINSGSWVEFRHNYALRTKGWTPGKKVVGQSWSFGSEDKYTEWGTGDDGSIIKTWTKERYKEALEEPYPTVFTMFRGEAREDKNNNRQIQCLFRYNTGSARCAEIDTSRFGITIPVNRFTSHEKNNSDIAYNKQWRGKPLEQWNVDNSAYYVDNSIVTLNCPELEMSTLLNELPTEDLKFRIIGIIPLTATVSSTYYQEGEGAYNPQGKTNTGINPVIIRTENYGPTAFRGAVSHNTYLGGNKGPVQWFVPSAGTTYEVRRTENGGYLNYSEYNYAYHPLYPWQAAGTVAGFEQDTNEYKNFSTVGRKVLANLRYSAFTYYFTNNKNFEVISDSSNNNNACDFEDRIIGWKPYNESVVSKYFDNEDSIITFNVNGYTTNNLVYSGNINTIATASTHDIFTAYYGRKLINNESVSWGVDPTKGGAFFFWDTKKTGVGSRIKYKSSPHWVVSFNLVNMSFTAPNQNNLSSLVQETLPTIGMTNLEGYRDLNNLILSDNTKDSVFGSLYEDDQIGSVYHQASIKIKDCMFPVEDMESDSIDHPMNYGWLWLGEIYRDTKPTFGGSSEEALKLNTWIPAGEKVVIPEIIGANTEIDMPWTQGDTYYQRFDTLKTYSYSDTDTDSIVDITSFMLETRINLDGRYDNRRMWEDQTSSDRSNFNLINEVYLQKDNLFTYNIIDKTETDNKYFPNQIVWSLPKQVGSKIDNWLNITVANAIDLDGDKGSISALKTWNNEILAFQDQGIATVLYNSRVQVASSEDVPIQIANSGRVEGYRYLQNNIGCQDKWNIVESIGALYFIDYYNKNIYRISNTVESLSETKGFRSWCKQNINNNSKITGFFDSQNKDIIFIDNTNTWQYPTLAFNEYADMFTSFYNYKDANLINILGKNIWVTNNGEFYLHNKGNANCIFKEYYPYSISITTPNENYFDKILYNLEFTAVNSLGEEQLSFDHIKAGTSDQETEDTLLIYNKYRPSNLKKKFNIWRAAIPREKNSKFQNRIRNTWANITISKKQNLNNNAKIKLQNLILHYGI